MFIKIERRVFLVVTNNDSLEHIVATFKDQRLIIPGQDSGSMEASSPEGIYGLNAMALPKGLPGYPHRSNIFLFSFLASYTQGFFNVGCIISFIKHGNFKKETREFTIFSIATTVACYCICDW